MPEYSTDVTSRDESAEETAVLLVALAGKVRQKIAAKLGGTLPSDPSEIFQASWWDDEINAAIDDHLTAVAASAASAAHEGIGLGEIDADERDDIAGYVAAAVALMLLSRSEVVTGRVTDVLESALAEGKSPERVARELGVTEDDESGPLSAALMTAIGVSAGLALIDMATGETVDRALAAGKVTGTKTWWAVGDDRTRPSHRTASGQEVPLDAMFDVGGFEGPFPHSPLLPVHETAGCRCWLTYQVDTVAAGETGSGDVDGLELDEVEDVLGVAASAAATLEDRMKPKTATAETSADMPADPPSMEPEGEPPADLGSVPDDVLSDELARRLAETVIAESQTDGSEVSADEAAVIFEAASDAVAVALAEAHDALEAAEPVEETEPVEDADDSGEPVTDDGMMMAARELVAELRSSSSFAASFVLSGNVDLPIAERDRPWDGNDAVQHMELRASSDGTGDPSTIDWTVFADGFLWHEENPSTVGAFKLPFCDVIDGELKIVPAGVFAAAQRLDQTDIPDGDKTEVKGRLSTLYEKIAAKYDDDKLVTPFAVNQDRYMGRPFAFDGYPPAPANVEPDGEGILCVEGVPSDDGRLIAEGALDWRQLPLPMTFINRITERHQDAEFCGWWTSIERRGQAIWGEFVLADNPAAEELRSYMADPRGPGRFGVSADIGGTKIVYATSDGSILSPPEAQEAYWSGEEITEMMIEGVCLGGTGVAHPAFADAQIWLIESNRAETAEALVASGGARTVWSTFRSDSLVPYGAGQGLVASAAGPDPDAPHSSWFEMRPGPVPPFMVFPDGRCIAAGSRVQTKRGYLAIENVKEGDLVLTHKGNWHPVVGSKSRIADETVRVSFFRQSAGLQCTPDHRIWSKDVNGEIAWREAAELHPGDFVSFPRQRGELLESVPFPSDCRVATVEELERWKVCLDCNDRKPAGAGLCGRCRKRRSDAGIPLPDQRRRPGKFVSMPSDVPLNGDVLWLFGRYLADGCTIDDRRISLAGHVDEWDELERANSIFKDNFGVSGKIVRAKGTLTIELRVNVAELAKAFTKWFNPELSPEKIGKGRFACTKKLPSWLLGLAPEQSAALLEGIMSGDGYRQEMKSGATKGRLTVASPHLAAQVAVLAAQLGHAPSLNRERKKYWSTSWTENGSYKYVPHHNASDDEYVWHMVNEVSEESEAVVYDLEVSGDHSFVVEHVAVHNCFGLACTWEDVHIGLPKTTKPPKLRDVTNFYGAPAWTEFYTGDVLKRFYVDGKYVLTSDGKMVEVGPLILDNVHPDLRRNASDSQAFYASTGAAVADVRVHFTNQGIVLAGAMRPTATTTDARILRASSISPDWRPIDGKLRLIAFLAVNVSAFQMEGLAASAGRAGTYCEVDETTGEVLALVATGGCASRERTLAETVEFLLVRQAQMETELAEARRFVAREKAREALELLDIGGLRRRRVVEARSALVTLGLASPDPEAVAALRVLASEPAAA